MHPRRSLALAAGALAVAAATLAATSSAGVLAWSAAPAKPVIGAPKAAPAKPEVGKPFNVSFKVTNSSTHGPLAAGAISSTVAAGGAAVAHTQSFRGGVARVQLVVPVAAGGNVLRITVTIKTGGTSASKTVSFAVPALPKPSISIDGDSVSEGNSNTTLAFTVTLSSATPLPVSVGYATANGTATGGADFTSATGTLAFKPGETSKTIEVTVIGDTSFEPDETFTVALSNPVNATIGTGSATGTIQNDDPVAQPGHYEGKTQDNEAWNFDVTADGRGVTNLATGQVNMSCSYAGQKVANTYGGNIRVSGTIPIAANGSFSATVNFTGGTIGGYPITANVFTFAGQFTNNTASGTWNRKLNFTIDNTYGIECTSGNGTWTATRAG